LVAKSHLHVVHGHPVQQVDREHDALGVRISGSPGMLPSMPEGPERRVPGHGEHTRDNLATELGLDDGEIRKLVDDSAAQQAPSGVAGRLEAMLHRPARVHSG
jgi:hypothetical protein